MNEYDGEDKEKDWVELECGCIFKNLKKEGHIWHLEMDFSNCKDHTCDDDCEQILKRSSEGGVNYMEDKEFKFSCNAPEMREAKICGGSCVRTTLSESGSFKTTVCAQLEITEGSN